MVTFWIININTLIVVSEWNLIFHVNSFIYLIRNIEISWRCRVAINVLIINTANNAYKNQWLDINLFLWYSMKNKKLLELL